MKIPDYNYVTVIASNPQRVWEALTTAEFTRQYWHSTRVKSDWRVGSPIEFLVEADDGEDAVGCQGEILVADYPGELSYTWSFPRNSAVADEAPSRVTFLLEALGEHTRLTITHDQFPDQSEMYGHIRDGWPLVLAGLKTLLETGKAVDFSVF
jgi:uncharacterized protein YndB with AHSA1/START domain